MHYFELICTAFLKQSIDFKQSFEIIGKYITFSLYQGGKGEIHENNSFKHYCFSSFTPIEKEKVYKSGSLYTFTIRSFDEQLISTLASTLTQNINNEFLIVVSVKQKTVNQFFISELYSATPVVITTQKGHFWTLDKDGDIIRLQQQLHDNLERKYQTFFHTPLHNDMNFIQLIEIKNTTPHSIVLTKENYKVRLFGNKFKIVPNEDEISQKLAFTALACGLGEKNSFGGGFILARGGR